MNLLDNVLGSRYNVTIGNDRSTTEETSELVIFVENVRIVGHMSS